MFELYVTALISDLNSCDRLWLVFDKVIKISQEINLRLSGLFIYDCQSSLYLFGCFLNLKLGTHVSLHLDLPANQFLK